jgi:hypothetical protein
LSLKVHQKQEGIVLSSTLKETVDFI